jgi:deazaflavin-dependent oxidoreductase (nitroreductase family)
MTRMVGTLHRNAYRLSRGRIGGRRHKAPVLLLTTTGRRTGQSRTWPVVYLDDGDRYLIVASNAGSDRHPAWYLNLLDQPEVEVEVGGRREARVAEPLTVEDKERAWPRLVAMQPGFDSYRRKTGRSIPVIALTVPPRPSG